MNILTVLCKEGWMPGNLSEGWRSLGFTVHEFFYGTHMGKSWSSEGIKENKKINADLLETARRLKTSNQLDLIFAVIYDDVLTVETAQKLRNLDVPMVNYQVDMIGQWYRVLRTGPYFNLVACAQRDNWEGLKQAGIRPYYMPMAANPPDPSTLSSTSPMQFEGVLYMGSPWLYRRQVLAHLAQQDIPLQIYGHNWLRTEPDPANAQPLAKNFHDIRYYLWPRIQHESWSEFFETIQRRLNPLPPAGISTDLPPKCIKGSYASGDFFNLVQGAAINLGFTHFQGLPNTKKERRQVRLREFEIPMAGGFYLAQDCPQIRELFPLGELFEAWDKTSDLQEKICYYLKHPLKRQKIAHTMQSYCLNNHTWKHRFSSLLKEL
jgi:spore maturation protein CgeB